MEKFFIIALLIVLQITSIITTKAQEINCMSCHNDIMESKVIHEAAEMDCSMCHQTTGNEHPGSDAGFSITEQMPMLCYMCHDGIGEEMASKYIHAPAEDDCFNCHNPHSNSESKLLPETQPNLCNNCHGMNTLKNLHPPAAEGNCTDCHSAHGSNNPKILIDYPSKNICANCHDLEINENDVVHYPVESGDCQECHDPHQSDFSSLLKSEMPNTCFNCHDGIGEEMASKYTHAPAEDDCFNCHNPHSNLESKLLPETQPDLCNNCHGMNTLKNLHPPAAEGNCTDCHSAHGSNNPKMLIDYPPKNICANCHDLEISENDVIHYPVESGDCQECHDPHQSDFSSLLKSEMPNTCFNCHDGIGEEMASKYTHAPAQDDCFNCHNPHSNKESKLLPETQPDLCNNCHGMNTLKNLHPPAAEGNCKDCHSAHGSNNPKMLIGYPPKNICANCHDLEINENDVVHYPVESGDCQECHDPHQSDFSSLLKSEMPNTCFNCHDGIGEEMASKYTHAPAQDDCFNCHNPHSNKESKLLSLNTPNLCYDCHDDIRESMENSPFAHQAVHKDASCLNCHSPHGSEESKMLKSSNKELCLSCHNRTYNTESGKIINIKKLLNDSKFIHGAVEFGECIDCHLPHASKNHSLLVNRFPEAQYTYSDESSFDLCFDCHDSEILETKESTTVTNFRNASQNLHYTHINGNKKRNCTNCHNVHASMEEHLIKDVVDFGNWEMSLNYKTTKNGGSCLPGCHGKLEYNRLTPEQIAEENYQNTIRQADAYFTIENYDKAKLEYEIALGIKKNENYPKEQISKINTIHEQKTLTIQQKYDDLVMKADSSFILKQYVQSKSYFQEAFSLKPQENYSKQKIVEIDSIIRENYLVSKNKYDEYVSTADTLFQEKMYEKALESYQLANNILPEEKYASEKISKITDLLSSTTVLVLNKDNFILNDEETKQISFAPISTQNRKSNYLYLIIETVEIEKNFRLIVNYGKGQEKNGGIVIRIDSNKESKVHFVNIGNQIEWYNEDNDWINLQVKGGKVEISLIKLTKGILD